MAIPLIMITQPQRWARQPQSAIATTGYRPVGRHKTASAALALGIAGMVGVGMATALVAPDLLTIIDGPLKTRNVPIEVEPPQPADPKEQQQQSTSEITVTHPPLPVATSDPNFVYAIPLAQFPPTTVTIGTATASEPAWVAPVLRAPRRNPRFADAFQPPYPAAQQREGVEGRCPVSVAISASGRVTSVRDLGCSDLAFFRATQSQALSRWRFEPATRDGVPTTGELTQNVIFRIGND